MKKTRCLFISVVIIQTLFTSCATAIKMAKPVEPFVLSNNLEQSANMDFLGFKIDSNILSTTSSSKTYAGFWTAEVDTVMSEFDQARAIKNTESLKKLGYILENYGIAEDKSSNYFGIYSLQEMELYKSNHRYATFVEVASSKLDYEDNKGSKVILGSIGASFIGGGLPLLVFGGMYKDDIYAKSLAKTYLVTGIGLSAVGTGFIIPALTPSKTKVNFNGVYNIYVYDTATKSLINKEAVSVNISETFKGSYTYDEASKNVVTDYISRIVSNNILEKYEEIHAWLNRRN